MRELIIILSNLNIDFDNKNLKIYRFDKNKSDVSELKKVVIDINKDSNETVYLITNKEDIEDAEIIEDKFNVIKGLYPNVADEVIKYVISILESKIVK